MARETAIPRPMRFPFNDKKAAQAAAYVLKIHGSSMSYGILVKVLYMADRASLVRHGQTITGDAMFALGNGPVLSSVLNLAKHNPLTPIPPEWDDYIGEPRGIFVSLKKESPVDELSDCELLLLNDAHRDYGNMEWGALVNHLHKILPEWKDPGKSRLPIDPADILRAECVPNDVIDTIRADAAELLFIDSLAR